MNKGITLRVNQASVKRLLPRLSDHVLSSRLNPKGLISHRIPLEEMPDAYHMFSARRDNILRTRLWPSLLLLSVWAVHPPDLLCFIAYPFL